jgi:hypothetical protein
VCRFFGRVLLAPRLALACVLIPGCQADDDEGSSSNTGASSSMPSPTRGSTTADGTAGDGGSEAANEVDCSDAPSQSLPVCLPRREDGACTDPPDEVELCRRTCIETCCFPVEEIACGPDVAQTDRCCYWILVGEMSCADTAEQTCLAD